MNIMAEKTKHKMTKARKIYNIVSTIIVALIFVGLIAIVAMMFIQKKNGQDSKIFGYYMYDVVTDSMTPTIEPGSVILSKAVKSENEFAEGDIITFIAPSGALKGYNETHRIVHIERNEDGSIKYIKTEGDKYNPTYSPSATEEIDEWELKPQDVKAKYVKTSKFIGGLRNFLSKWYGYVVLIALPMIIVMILFIVGYVKDKAEIAREEEKKNAIENGTNLDSLTEEDKKRLLEEYLKQTDDKTEEGSIGDSKEDVEPSNEEKS